MSQTHNAVDQKEIQKTNETKNSAHGFVVVIREIVAMLFWGYVITKVFILDIDLILVEKLSPNYLWLIQYKFFILLGLLAIILLVTKNKQLILWSLFIIFYPLLLIFWRIPVLLFRRKSWSFLLALIDSIVPFLKSFRFTFIALALFLISVVVILTVSNPIPLWISMTVMLTFHFWVFLQKFLSVLKPSGADQVYIKIFSFFGELVKFKPVPAAPTAVLSDKELELTLEDMDEKQIQKWTTGVLWLALFNRVCLFVAKKIKSYLDSRFNIISSVFGILILVLFTVLSFSLLNFGLFKINPNYFSFQAEPTIFNFFYYSFNIFLFNPIQEIIAKAPIAQIANMVEYLFAIFLIAIFVSLVFSFRSQRETEELNNLIAFLTEEGTKAEGVLKDKYRLNTVEEAMEALQKLNSIFAEWLFKITNTINS